MPERCTGGRRLVIFMMLVLSIGGTMSASAALLPRQPYVAKDWNLAWQAFLGAGEVRDAYALALVAVRARPESRLWLERLAQSARWSGHSRAAFNALYRLAIDLHAHSYLRAAMNMAFGLGDNGRSITLLRTLIRAGKATPAERRMLSGLYLNEGEPLAAIRQLQREFARHPERMTLLWEQGVIYRLMGDPGSELRVLKQYQQRFGATPRVMLAISTLEYVHGRYQSALESLLAARPRAKPGDRSYWETLSGLAWMMGKYRLAARASGVLIRHHVAGTADYIRVIYVDRYTDPRHAFHVAAQGWRSTHAPYLFIRLLNIASSLKPSAKWLQRAFALLPEDQSGRFARNPSYWSSRAQLDMAQGHFGQAIRHYHRALDLEPENQTLLAGYLWLYLQSGRLRSIKPELAHISRMASHSPALWEPLAAIYSALDQPQRALGWLQREWSRKNTDPLWLINVAATLEQADQPRLAWSVRRRALTLLDRRLKQNPQLLKQAKVLRQRGNLSMALTPGDPARKLIFRLSQHDNTYPARVVVLSWLLEENSDALARLWQLRAFSKRLPPAWARLSTAMYENDAPSIGQLLEQDVDRLPRRDRVNAAQRLGWTNLAITLAYEGLAGEPGDQRLQRLFRNLALPRSDYVGISPSVESASGLLAQGMGLEARHWISPQSRLLLNVVKMRQTNIDSALLGTAPSRRQTFSLVWRRTLQRGLFELSAGHDRDLAGWLHMGMRWQRQLEAGLSTTVDFRWADQALDTVPLSLAGMKDRLRASIDFQPTPRVGVQGILSAGRFRAQGGGSLGTYFHFALDGNYRLWSTPPDYTLDLSVSGRQYHPSTSLPTQLDQLVPVGTVPTVGFFIPQSYLQACVGGHFNTRFIQSYAGQLRPFAAMSICANSAIGSGYNLEAGVALPALGSDHLSLVLNLGNNFGASRGQMVQLDLRYHYFFSPIH